VLSLQKTAKQLLLGIENSITTQKRIAAISRSAGKENNTDGNECCCF